MQDNQIKMTGLSNEVDFMNARNANKQVALWQAKINAYFDAISSIQDPKEKNVKLEKLLSNTDIKQNMTSNQLMKLFTYFRNNGNFEAMIKLVDSSKNDVFNSSLMVKEKIMLAYNKMNRPLPAIKWGEICLASGAESSNIYLGMGDAIYSLSKMLDTEKEKQDAILSSAKVYEKAFLKYQDYTPGVKATTSYLEVGDIKKAKKMARLVFMSTLKNNHNENTDYWCASARLEACCVAKNDEKTLTDALNYLLNLKSEKWFLESTLESITKINKTIKSPNIEKVIYFLDKRIKGDCNIKRTQQSQKNTCLNAIYDKSFSYRGLASTFDGSNSVGGNTKFGGQLPDHSVSRKDFEFFDKVLKTPIEDLFPKNIAKELYTNKDGKLIVPLSSTISEIKDVNMFMSVVNKFVRYHFGTENFAHTGFKLETNVENPKNPYNSSVLSLLEVSGKKGDKSADTRTNISSIFAMGLGDCRHHAQVKQIMFDRWRDAKMYTVLDKMAKQGITRELSSEFYDLLRVELRTIDVKVEMPIELNGPYSAKKTPDGKFIYCEENKNKSYEEHTLNILITKDKNGEFEKLSLQDAFYQNVYDFENHDIDIEKELSVNENGEFSILAGTMSGKKVSNGEDIPIIIEPTVYAGKRDKADDDEHGNNIKLIGLPMGIDNAEEFINKLQNRDNTNKILNQLRNGYEIYCRKQEQEQER